MPGQALKGVCVRRVCVRVQRGGGRLEWEGVHCLDIIARTEDDGAQVHKEAAEVRHDAPPVVLGLCSTALA